jgi:hypothetical protein
VVEFIEFLFALNGFSMGFVVFLLGLENGFIVEGGVGREFLNFS